MKLGCHVGLFSDNKGAASWVCRFAAKSLFIADQLLRALALRQKKRQTSPLTPMHVAGKKNAITDIPSRSFGSKKKWQCKTDSEVFDMFNQHFPFQDSTPGHSFALCPGSLRL